MNLMLMIPYCLGHAADVAAPVAHGMLASLAALPHQPGAMMGAMVGAIGMLLLPRLVTPALAVVTKYLLAVTAKIVPLVAAAAKRLAILALSLPVVLAIIKTNPKAWETLIDTIANCLTAVILAFQTAVDDQIEEAGLDKSPDAPVAPTAPTQATK